MKGKIFFLLCIFSCSNLYAQWQTRDFKYYNYQIDSIMTAYSVDTFKNRNAMQLRFSAPYLQVDLSVEERKILLSQIGEMFEQKQYTNLFPVGHELLDQIWRISPRILQNPPEINQIIVELYLQYYFYPGRYDNIVDRYFYDLKIKENYTEKSKKRIVEILENKKTQEEFDLWLKYEKSNSKSYAKASRDIAERIMQKREIQNDTIFAQIRDSIFTNQLFVSSERRFNSLKIIPELILMTGFLDMKECVPTMQKNLQNLIESKEDKNSQKAYRFALAKLGDTIQYPYILENYMSIGEFDRNLFAYFRDDDMIWKYIEVNYSFEKGYFPFSHGGGISFALKTMNDIYPFIKNVPEELKYYPDKRINDMETYTKWSKDFYDWLMANKNKIEFNYDGEKKWDW